MSIFNEKASAESIAKVVAGLKANGMNVEVVGTGAEAKQKVLELIPEGADVMTMTSVTLDTLGIAQELNESGKYAPTRKKFETAVDEQEKRRFGAGPAYTVGSAHAVTEDGQVVVASNTGSQLPAYAYGAGKVVWVIGTQKIVSNLKTAMQRIYDYVLPLEADRARKAYGIPEDKPGSFVSKILIVNKEVEAERITVILVEEPLGF